MSSHLSHLSQFDHTKLNAQVFRDANLVVETHLVSNLVSGQRRVPLQKVWRVDRVIGKGAFGEIRLEVLMEGSGEQRAVKRLWTSGSTLKREYQRELEALVEFSKVKYKEAAVFVDFLGWFEDADSVYLAMEYIPLGDLEHNVPSRSGQLAGSEIRLITSQILEGLKIMHSESFVHRDLKPKVTTTDRLAGLADNPLDTRAVLISHSLLLRMSWYVEPVRSGGSSSPILD